MKLVIPKDWVKVKYDYCVACGVSKNDKHKGLCYAWGSLVNKGRHQYIGYAPSKTNDMNESKHRK